MKISIFTVIILALSSTAMADEIKLMTCNLDNGGVMLITANRDKTLNLYFDGVAQSALNVANALSLSTMLEAVSSGDTQGPIDFMESGAGYYGSGGTCGMGLDFATDNQRFLGEEGEIPLKPGTSGYKRVSCGQAALGIASCIASSNLNSVEDLKEYLPIEEGD